MIADPPVRSDGRCLVCGGPRNLSGLKLLYRQAMEVDPFCSMPCARRWWGTSLPQTSADRRMKAYTS